MTDRDSDTSSERGEAFPTDDSWTDAYREWTYEGRPCRIGKHDRLGHYCGYAQTALTVDRIEDVPPEVRAPGGITYVDEDGWVGFDCGHYNDFCFDEDGELWGTMAEINATMLSSRMESHPLEPRMWGVEDVIEAVETMAADLSEAEDNG
jgi:hypothetical protein